jgi:opacity protein-like surface antigen
MALCWPSLATAEPYLAAYVGGAFTETKDLHTRLDLSGVTILDGDARDLKFDKSVVVGGKVGYFFEPSLLGANIGLEAEAFHFQPDVRQQNSRFVGSLGGFPADQLIRVQHADIEVTGAALNLLLRVPLAVGADFPHGRFQPYAGVGLAMLIATLSTTTTPFDVNKSISDTDVQPALQVIGGVRASLSPHVFMFLEYKFLQSRTFTFDFRESGTFSGFPAVETARDRADLTSHHVSVGVGVNW